MDEQRVYELCCQAMGVLPKLVKVQEKLSKGGLADDEQRELEYKEDEYAEKLKYIDFDIWKENGGGNGKLPHFNFSLHEYGRMAYGEPLEAILARRAEESEEAEAHEMRAREYSLDWAVGKPISAAKRRGLERAQELEREGRKLILSGEKIKLRRMAELAQELAELAETCKEANRALENECNFIGEPYETITHAVDNVRQLISIAGADISSELTAIQDAAEMNRRSEPIDDNLPF